MKLGTTFLYQTAILLKILYSDSRAFLLLIAIDKYASYDLVDLKGAVADAEDVKKYFQEVVGVPKSRIKTLYNTKATRGAIIKSLHAIIRDRQIERGDPIVIFYAGHGGQGKPPPGWPAGNKRIQYILSYNFTYDHVSNTCANEVKDFEIGEILEGIAKEKGDNIVSPTLHSMLLC